MATLYTITGEQRLVIMIVTVIMIPRIWTAPPSPSSSKPFIQISPATDRACLLIKDPKVKTTEIPTTVLGTTVP
ncbi:Hypothetical predicted protein [Marmota monax]|uniref:Uncharacterized protein n=1 Tax=Marmota monax TaxID=9995 RepID=A0A5E4BY74_MARMO|nr:hypothetical protein GHT09_015857 [Marmota monax]VTJ74577.1 Hypothetical predicted protein [Marmota monax]